jgi:hypothetical protein
VAYHRCQFLSFWYNFFGLFKNGGAKGSNEREKTVYLKQKKFEAVAAQIFPFLPVTKAVLGFLGAKPAKKKYLGLLDGCS